MFHTLFKKFFTISSKFPSPSPPVLLNFPKHFLVSAQFFIYNRPWKNRPHVSKWWYSLFSRILFSESLKLSRNHPKVLKLKKKNIQNTYFRSYSVLVPEPPVEVPCCHFFVFWVMIHQVLRFIG